MLNLALKRGIVSHKKGTVYSMEWSLGAEIWSEVLTWSGVKFWNVLAFFIRKYNMSFDKVK